MSEPRRSVVTQLLDRLAWLRAELDGSPAQRDQVARHVFDSVILAAAARRTAAFGPTAAGLGLDGAAAMANGPRGWPVGVAALRDPREAGLLAAAIRSSEADDIHLASCVTPASVVVPAALAAACWDRAVPIARFVAGVAAGYEAMTWAATRQGGAALLRHGIWPSYLVAPLGGCVAAATVIDLPPDRWPDALALAFAVTNSGHTANAGADPSGRWLAFALAVEAGLTAARGAQAGLRGDPGLPDRMLRAPYVDDGAPDYSAGPAIAETSLKPYNTGRQSLGVVTAFQAVLRSGVRPETIEVIDVGVPGEFAEMVDRPAPFADQRALRGVQYQLALAAYRPEELVRLERHPIVDDPRLGELAARVRIHASRELTAAYPRAWGGEVTVRTAHRVLTRRAIVVPGDPARPLSWDQLRDKACAVLTSVGLDPSAHVETALAWSRSIAEADDDRPIDDWPVS